MGSGKASAKMRDLGYLVAIAAVLLAAGAAQAKSGRTYYTEERLGWMRDNLANYEWAATERDKIIAVADRWVKYDNDRLKDLVPPLQVPRCGTVHNSGCPVHGEDILKHPRGKKSWKMSFDNMYKIQCPVGGEWYPSNDFWAYLQGGCKDKGLLTGEYVDDGWGWQAHEGEKKYWFVGFFAGEMTRRWLLPAIRNMSQAYLLTGEQAYAHKAAVLLWQLARYYPDYAYENQSRYALEFMTGYNGRLQYHTWECFTIQDLTLAYDAIYPALADDNALEKWTGKSCEQVKTDIENRIFRLAARDITDGSHRIAGNYGMHQSALLRIALVLDTDEGEQTSADMVEWVLKGPEVVSRYSDTPLPDAVVNLFHRDGVPFESPSYNCHWMTDLEEVAELLLANGVNMWEQPRFRMLYEWPMKLTVCGTMSQPMGDSNNQFAGALGASPTYLEGAFGRMRDPRQAASMVQAAERGSPFRTRLFEKSLEADIRQAAEQYGNMVGVESSLLPGLGYATLQTGNDTNRTAIALYYGYYTAHAHTERLNLEIYSHNHTLIPDFGYPETADTYDPRRFGWLAHAAVHNTVMVDAKNQSLGDGELVTYHPGGWVQMVAGRALSAYPDIELDDFRRAVFLIDVDDDTAYCVDVFHVAGGKQHDWLVHGPPSDITPETVDFSEPRTEGTFAGPDIPYGQFYDEPDKIEGKPGTRYYPCKGSAYQWLFNVQEARLTGTGTVRWDLNRDPKLYPYKETAGIGLRAHLLGDNEAVFACDGIPQRRKDFPEKHKWIIRRRTGDNLRSSFATVFEPFNENAPSVRSVQAVTPSPDDGSVAVQIVHTGGTDLIFWTQQPDQQHSFGGYEINGRAAAVRLNARGELTAARLFDGTSLQGNDLHITSAGPQTATITDIDYEHNVVTLDQPWLKPEHTGAWLTVATGQHKAAVRIDEVLDPHNFSLGDQDLRCGIGNVLALEEGNLIKGDRVMYFVHPGMAVVNEAHDLVGHFATREATNIRLAEKNVAEEAFNDADGDGRRRFVVMAIGAGNTVVIPTRADLTDR